MNHETYDPGAKNLMDFINEELERGKESSKEFITRVLSEAPEKLDRGLEKSEVPILISQLLFVIEKTADPVIKAAAQNYLNDIQDRYPDVQ